MRFKKTSLPLLMILALLFSLTPALAEDTPGTFITLDGAAAVITGPGAALEDHQLRVTEPGVYQLSGSSDSIQLSVEAAKDAEVTLLLNGLTLAFGDASAVTASGCDKLILKPAAGTVNTISAQRSDLLPSGTDTESEFPAVLCKCDTQIKGSGTLKIISSAGPALRVTKDLKIKNGVLEITSSDTGIRVKDDMEISGGSITITAEGDGIHSGREATEASAEGDDPKEAEPASGLFHMSGGTVTIIAARDGIQSENDLLIESGTLSVISGGGVKAAPAHTQENFGGGRGPGGYGVMQQTADTVSCKGIKAGNTLTITGGVFTVDSADDAIHSDHAITITGGMFAIASGDDALHADDALTIDDGVISVSASYEGIESANITINGGDITVISSDDGINTGGGSDSFGMGGFGSFGPGGGRGGMGGGRGGFGGWNGAPDAAAPGPAVNDTENTLPSLIINGGTLYINAQGDGLDSNGDLTVNGGFIIVDGPSDSMNGSLDSGSESGGVLSITGGTVLAIGASGMAEVFGPSSAQYSISAGIRFSAGDRIQITLPDGTVLIDHTAAKSGASIVFSHAALQPGETVHITCGSTERDITVTEYNNYNNPNNGPGGRGR